jgi:hypothetical protein
MAAHKFHKISAFREGSVSDQGIQLAIRRHQCGTSSSNIMGRAGFIEPCLPRRRLARE